MAVASEGVNYLGRSSRGVNLELKVDILKAFDTLRWDFLDFVLGCFGFSMKFRNWIKEILSSAILSHHFHLDWRKTL